MTHPTGDIVFWDQEALNLLLFFRHLPGQILELPIYFFILLNIKLFCNKLQLTHSEAILYRYSHATAREFIDAI